MPETLSTHKKFERVLASSTYARLSEPEFKNVLELLFNQQITPGKAIEALAELYLGDTPMLPKLVDDYCIYCHAVPESKVGRLDYCPCRDSRSLRHQFMHVGIDMGGEDICVQTQ